MNKKKIDIKLIKCVFLTLLFQLLLTSISYKVSKKYTLLSKIKLDNTPALVSFILTQLLIVFIVILYINSEILKNEKFGFHKRFAVFVAWSLYVGCLLSIYDDTSKVKAVLIQLLILWTLCLSLSFYLSLTDTLDFESLRKYYIVLFLTFAILEFIYIILFMKQHKGFHIVSVLLSLLSTAISTNDLVKKKQTCLQGSFQFYTELIDLFQKLYKLD